MSERIAGTARPSARIVRLANFVTPSSGGLRTALHQLGAGYLAAGHEPVLVIPGPAYRDEFTAQGRVITLPGPVVPRSGGYRVLLGRRRIARLLTTLAPDRIEVSDRSTLRWTGEWARRTGTRSVMVSHESLDGLLGLAGPALRPAADRLNARTAASYDRIVCTTAWAAAEFARIGAPNLTQVPLGVDLTHFHPGRYDRDLRRSYADPTELLLFHCGRLSPEKKPERSVAALAELRARGVPAVLVIAGDGPLRERMQASAARARLPVWFLRYVADRNVLARLLATADVVLAPGPIETFGLAALEALASGTPVVVSAQSALPEVTGSAGLAADGDGPAYADAIQELAVRPRADRRAEARRRAERYPWSAAVAGFLRAHDLTPGPGEVRSLRPVRTGQSYRTSPDPGTRGGNAASR
ncbi:MAG: alpha,6-mannosyltransferase [Cryptosporangiaceae bacterium]|nr:alpha,6-mannosyltransferase [Cryptosporangiaceae bacterium]